MGSFKTKRGPKRVAKVGTLVSIKITQIYQMTIYQNVCTISENLIVVHTAVNRAFSASIADTKGDKKKLLSVMGRTFVQ